MNDTGYWTGNTARVQVGQLRTLLRAAAGTEFGRGHDFGRIAELGDGEIVGAYRASTPVADWYAFKDQIARMREGGESDVLWRGKVMDFAQTSGTTAGDKFIPVSKEMLRSNFLAALDIFANAQRFGVDVTRLMGGKCLFLGGSTDLATNEHGVRTGDLSGLVAPLIRWPLSAIYEPGPEVAVMGHWPSKIEAMAKRCIDRDIRMISGMPSWANVLFERVIGLARERGRDVSCVRDVWPNLTLFVHGGVKYGPFEPRVRQLFSGKPGCGEPGHQGGDIPWRLELYPASEGFIAMQDVRGDPGLRLLSDIGNFYEFVPLGEIDSPSARAFSCWEVERGQKYVVVMSTCAGLWRYVIGDVVEFETVPRGLDGQHRSPRAAIGGTGGEGPCRMRIVGRHRHFINAFGENLIVEHIENAVAAGGGGGLELAVEVEGKGGGAGERGSGGAWETVFRDAFDGALKAQNVDYTTKRTDGLGMVEPTITVLPVGAFHAWLLKKGKLGGQHKCPRCANHRDILMEVVAAGRG